MLSPNMNLNVPAVATTQGPQYAEDINSSLNKIDAHNHTSGQGLQIPTAGLNIDSNLSLNNFGITNASRIGLVSQNVPPAGGSVYRNNDDLYYVDGTGANVRITQGGAVAVSGAVGFSGLPFGTAGASYNNLNQSFVFQSATNTAANLDCGSVTLREVVASANGVTLASPLVLAASYTMYMPSALPIANSYLELSPAGNVSAVPSFVVQNPVGSIIMFGGSVAPTGWLLCDGSVVSQAVYANLFGVIGSAFNTGGEGIGNFRLPNFQRRTGVGAGGAGTATLGNAVGNSGGAESVTLTTAEMPSHTHTDSGHTHPNTTYASAGAGGFLANTNTIGGSLTTINTGSGVANIQSTGGGGAHNNIQPSLVVNYIIKT